MSWRSGVVYAARQGLAVYGQYATAADTIGNVISNSPGRLFASRVGNTPPNVPELAANAWVTWSALWQGGVGRGADNGGFG